MAAISVVIEDCSGLANRFASAPDAEVVAQGAGHADGVIEAHCAPGGTFDREGRFVIVVSRQGKTPAGDVKQPADILAFAAFQALSFVVAAVAVVRAF